MRGFPTGKDRLKGLMVGFAICSGLTVICVCQARSQDAVAVSAAPKSGHYVTEKGWGHLEVSPSGDGLHFALETVTGEDICSLQGSLEGDRGTAKEDGGEASCVVRFKKNPNGSVSVAPITSAECKTFCGYNGGFEGDYLSVPARCTDQGLEAAYKKFRPLYDARQYKPALAVLSPLLAECLPTLSWQQEGGLRNDLAVTQYHNGMYRQCLAALAPYADDAAKDDEAVIETWPPVLAEGYLSIIKSVRTNIRLCRKASGVQ